MFTLILTLSMIHPAPAATQTAQFQPCVWPNKCVSAPVAQFTTCKWPNKCVTPVAQVTTCQWPHTCGKNS
jgi:hypothetical protein